MTDYETKLLRVELAEKVKSERYWYERATRLSAELQQARMRAPWRGGGLVGLPRTCGDLATVGYEWYYNWSPTPSCPNAGVPFVPMVKSGFKTLPPLPPGSGPLLTFNEPDAAGMTVDRALGLWPQLEATGHQLGSPAVTATARGSSWLRSFMNAVKVLGYRVDFIAAHWYGTHPAALMDYLDSLHERYELPVWLTEVGCYGRPLEENVRFAERIGPLLAARPYLRRVGWFCNRSLAGGYEHSGLVAPSGTLTPVGVAYKAWQKDG